MAIKRECGIEHQGDVAITGAGRSTNFSYILHCCIMDYNSQIPNSRRFPSLETIEISLQNIEKYLKLFWQKYNRKVKIAIPLLGCGVGSLNPYNVAKIYREFFERELPFDVEVIIYAYGENNFELVEKVLRD